jgi:sugar lactone lactonase YvrE
MTSAAIAELIDIIPAGNTLGEGVLWDPAAERLWWTDIQERRLFRYDPASRALERFKLPERLGSFGFVEGGGRIIAAFESGFALYRPQSAQLDWIARLAHDGRNVRLNDGRVDGQGRFWAGSMVEGDGEPRGRLYCLHGGAVRVCLSGIAISNSICFGPGGRHLYFADTPHREIVRYDIDPDSCELSNRRVFARTQDGGFPDGSIIDAEGCLWNAQWAAGRVVRYAPDGSVSAVIEVPASQVTCVAFGGRRLDTLFVTSAREGLNRSALERQPHAGDVFVYRLRVKGLVEPCYVSRSTAPPA